MASIQGVNKLRFVQLFNDGQIPPVEGILKVPGAHVTLHDVLAEGDVVIGFVTAVWTHDGTGPGTAPADKTIHFQGAFAYRFRDGAPVAGLQMWDEGPLFAQRGETLSPLDTPLYFGSDFAGGCRQFAHFWDPGREPLAQRTSSRASAAAPAPVAAAPPSSSAPPPSYRTCSTCGGRGQTSWYSPGGPFSGVATGGTAPCATCKGTGRVRR